MRFWPNLTEKKHTSNHLQFSYYTGVEIMLGQWTWGNIFATWSVINFPNFKLCPVIFLTKNLKSFSSFLGFKVIYQRSRNNEPKKCLFTT